MEQIQEPGSLANMEIGCRGLACRQPFLLPCLAGPFETQGQQAFIGPLVEPIALLDPLLARGREDLRWLLLQFLDCCLAMGYWVGIG